MSAYIDYVKSNYEPSTVLLEIGAGHRSTKAFAEYFDKMYSIEHNSQFCNIYHKNYIQIPLATDGWYDSQKFSEALKVDYSLIILDGPVGGFDPPFIKRLDKIFRKGFCRHFDEIKRNVDIIVDDTCRDWYEKDVVKFLSEQGYNCIETEYYTICKAGVSQ